jgi:2,3-bisphosphoglycerate-dependent phosphoglycerate mutase
MLAYFVRHGQSESNAGRSNLPDSALSDLGRRQASQVADRLARVHVCAIYSSPFRRSIQTAMPLAQRLGLTIRIRPDIVEHFWAGFANLEHYVPGSVQDLVAAWPGTELDPVVPAGAGDWPVWPESVEALANRMRRFVEHLKRTWGDTGEETVAVFSHGAPVARALEAWIIDRPGPEFRFDVANATVNLVRFRDGVSTMLALNEASHLDD